MKDFAGVFLMLLLVMAGILAFVFLSELLGFVGMAILEIIIVVGIILLAIRLIKPRP
ncbi:hypothetical protein [Nafulsella turpanensis]|uniref:hypothetical protein n=1 Tax=Nafulsella turpanensis TaxID=1265690 RepID=UPI0003477030|nr:hypothetical protein [Nafulsella turpanensis]